MGKGTRQGYMYNEALFFRIDSNILKLPRELRNVTARQPVFEALVGPRYALRLPGIPGQR